MATSVVPGILTQYRAQTAAKLPGFLVPRSFITNESWIEASGDSDTLALSLFRDNAPDLTAILQHRTVLILGEPGAGKSTTGKAVAEHLLTSAPQNHIPVLATLKDYGGNLANLLAQSTPCQILSDPALTRTYILDGIDEVPPALRTHLVNDLNTLLASEAGARMVLTARQAFYAHHPNAFPKDCNAYHLLDLNDRDITDFAQQAAADVDAFITAVRDIDCEQEIRNPFVLTSMLERYKEEGHLSPLRSDNIGYVINRLINSRPVFNAVQKRRALRMIAITCETAARNALTDDEARRVLLEAMSITPETANQLLDELSHLILVKTPGKISFQMRSYGEYLAAEELSDKSLERLRELSFIANEPVDTWQNTITYLAEMNEQARQFFANQYPLWLINVSPQAFTHQERSVLTRRLISDINNAQQYLVNQRLIPRGRIGRLLTDDVVNDLQSQLISVYGHEQANALVLLGIRGVTTIVPQALQLATAHRNASSLRYSAIVALINANDHAPLNDLFAFAQQTEQTGQNDPYHIHIVDAIGSLCAPQDFPIVLPLLKITNAGLSAAYYRFRELRSRDALTAALDYLTNHPETLEDYHLDSYLLPLLDLSGEYWDNDIAERIGLLLAAAEQEGCYLRNGNLAHKLVQNAKAKDEQGMAVKAAITRLTVEGVALRHIAYTIRPLITERTATWIVTNAPQYAHDVAAWLPPSTEKDILLPPTSALRQAQDAIQAQYAKQHAAEEQKATTLQEQHQETLRNGKTIAALVAAANTLPKEHWPLITAERHTWLQIEVGTALEQLDLATRITWISDNQLTLPNWLQPLLKLTDYYTLQLPNDVPLVLALRAWPESAVSHYAQIHGLSPAAQTALVNLLDDANDNITGNALSFLRDAEINDPQITESVQNVVTATQRDPHVRNAAIDLLPIADDTNALLAPLAQDTSELVSAHTFRILIKAQHRPTISKALGNLKDADLKAAEKPIPESTDIDWIGDIRTAEVHDELRKLRLRTLGLQLWRCTNLCTAAIANYDQQLAAKTIRNQLPNTPPDWREFYQQEATKLERTARINVAQTTSFDDVIKKLKGATSMISVKVWCEGLTDRPIFRRFLRDIGEDELANAIAPIDGWGKLQAEKEPWHYLDGCKEAIIVMDGDNGRHLHKRKKPYTTEAKEIFKRFEGYRITLYVLERYGIENYFTQAACEAVLHRDLTAYFPMPEHAKAQEHFSDPKPYWPRWINQFRRRQPVPFYRKGLNEEIAKHLSLADIAGTDLEAVIKAIKQQAEEARQY